MRNDIVKNKKLFSQYKFKLIKTIWNYFEHTELPQNEISNFFIEQDSLSNGKRIPNKVVIIKRGIIKQQSNISNTNQQVIYEETKSEELIHQSFETLKSIENGIIDDAHLIQAIDNMVIILETLLSSIIIESPEIDLLLSEFSNAFAALSNDLYGTKVEIHEKDRPDGNAESIVKILSNLLMDSQSYNDSAFSLAVYDILQTITENKKASEKTKAYVNDVFISLLAYYLCSQMKARGISLEQWFKDLTTHNLSEDKIAFKDYIDLGCDLLPFDTQRALRFLCSRDIQYWRKKIISSLKYNAKRNPGVYTNFSKSFFASILRTKSSEEVLLAIIDTKGVEFPVYNGDSHLMLPVITNTKDAFGFLDDLVEEIERRISLFNETRARKIEEYNRMVPEKQDPSQKKLPYIVVIVDEFSHLMLEDGKRFEKLIKRITAVARFCGIHLVISTNRCSADVITGIIKSNFPSQIAFAVTSGINSRILLDQLGAEKLLGSGDMLFSMGGWRNPIRVQGTFVDSLNEANQKSKN